MTVIAPIRRVPDKRPGSEQSRRIELGRAHPAPEVVVAPFGEGKCLEDKVARHSGSGVGTGAKGVEIQLFVDGIDGGLTVPAADEGTDGHAVADLITGAGINTARAPVALETGLIVPRPDPGTLHPDIHPSEPLRPDRSTHRCVPENRHIVFSGVLRGGAAAVL